MNKSSLASLLAILFLCFLGRTQAQYSVISTPQLVDSLKTISLKNENNQGQTSESIVQKYMKGVPGMADSLALILSSGTQEEKKNIVFELGSGSLSDEKECCKEAVLTQAFWPLMNDTLLERFIIQTGGYRRIPGYGDVFEKQLYTESSVEPDRIFFWLGYEGNRAQPINWVGSAIISGKIPFDNYGWYFNGFENYAREGNEDCANLAFEWCWKIYDKGIIPQKKFEELKSMYSSDNPASSITQVLLTKGDERVLPFALWCVEQDIYVSKAYEALARLRYPGIEKIIAKQLKKEDSFFDGMDAAETWMIKEKNPALLDLMIGQFEKHKFKQDYEKMRFAKCLSNLTNAGLAVNLTQIKSTQLRQELQQLVELESITTPQLIKDLISSGIIAPFKENEERRLISEVKDEPLGARFFACLERANILLVEDMEAGIVPVPYPDLLQQLFLLNNRFKELPKAVQVKPEFSEIEAGLKPEYLVYVFCNQQAYLFTPRDEEDWFDIEYVLSLMNKIAADAGQVERYQVIEGDGQMVSIVFADPIKISELLKKYKLAK